MGISIAGKATANYANGDIYEGQFEKGVRQGAGVYTCAWASQTREAGLGASHFWLHLPGCHFGTTFFEPQLGRRAPRPIRIASACFGANERCRRGCETKKRLAAGDSGKPEMAMAWGWLA